ncbi:DNA mismatch repair protein [Polyangium sp. 15x6]|uniref:MutS-related protein n=1 Tax=Polyangium sp. 15x6 TaxID=3042687 RepID=UPI00249A3DC5|nr:DNA mismatch repair protein [Polyangium sp. 15x6]MDI3288472.1 DNA mismatch repair protein [Polyangium sp. 15x6]
MKPSPPASHTAPAHEILSLLHPEPIARPDLEEMRQALSFAFASGVSGGLFSQALDRAPLAPSTWDPQSFAQDLFLEELVARGFRVRSGERDAVVNRAFIFRVLAHPPTDPRVTEHRRDILRELSSSTVFRRQFEDLYTIACRLRSALEGATAGKKFDATRRQLDVLVLVKEAFDRMSESFDGAKSGLSGLRAFGASVRETEGYRSMVDLLDYDEHLATLGVTIRVGADGRVRGFEVRNLRERQDNPFVLSPARRWLAKIEMFFRGYRFSDGEVMARLLDAVFEGVEAHVLRFIPLLGEMEVYLGALGFRDLAEAAGLEVCLPEIRPAAEDADDRPRKLLGLFNPLLVASGVRAVPCDLVTDRTSATVLITGPNSGGKTRLLQSVALAQILAQGGMFVPAREASLVRVPGLVVSLIQETRVDQSEGRLGMELVRIRALFEMLGPGAMVMLDELCSGTNPSEGEEIFELVITLLSKLRPQAFITTHFLTFAARLARENSIAGLRFIQVGLDAAHRPTYQFVAGVATTSLASHAAARLGVSRDELEGLIDRNMRAPAARARGT